jgi:hypothetical protein
LQGKPKYSEETHPSDTLSTTNPIWPDRTRTAALKSRRLTAWAIARPSIYDNASLEISSQILWEIRWRRDCRWRSVHVTATFICPRHFLSRKEMFLHINST